MQQLYYFIKATIYIFMSGMNDQLTDISVLFAVSIMLFDNLCDEVLIRLT